MILHYDSNMISQLSKSLLYRHEPWRIHRNGKGLTFQGENHEHCLRFRDPRWECDCDFYQKRQLCSHTMAVEWLEQQAIVSDTATVEDPRATAPASRHQRSRAGNTAVDEMHHLDKEKA